MKFPIIIFIFVFLSCSIQAEDLVPNFVKSCLGKACVEAKGNVWLRDSPPSGLFYTKGEKLDVVADSEILVIQEKKNVKTLFQNYEWLKVKRTFYKKDGSKIEPKVIEGWVYNGKIEGEPYFEAAKIPSIIKKRSQINDT